MCSVSSVFRLLEPVGILYTSALTSAEKDKLNYIVTVVSGLRNQNDMGYVFQGEVMQSKSGQQVMAKIT